MSAAPTLDQTLDQLPDESPAPDLSIIIVSYNTCDALRRCLVSISAHSNPLRVETIVVDNGSRDGSPAMARQEMPSALVIEPGYNSWFTGGNNLGLRAAKGRYALILNPDTVIQPGMLLTMVSYLQEHPEVGAITCRMQGVDGKPQFTGSELPQYIDLLLGYTLLGLPLFFWRNQRRRQMWYSGWDRQTTRPVEVIPDSCLMATSALLRQIGLFDETLKLYFTEDDLCTRIRRAGYPIHYVADTFVVHEEHSSTRQVQRLASQIYLDDLIVFTRHYYGSLAAGVLKILIEPTRFLKDKVQYLRDVRARS